MFFGHGGEQAQDRHDCRPAALEADHAEQQVQYAQQAFRSEQPQDAQQQLQPHQPQHAQQPFESAEPQHVQQQFQPEQPQQAQHGLEPEEEQPQQAQQAFLSDEHGTSPLHHELAPTALSEPPQPESAFDQEQHQHPSRDSEVQQMQEQMDWEMEQGVERRAVAAAQQLAQDNSQALQEVRQAMQQGQLHGSKICALSFPVSVFQNLLQTYGHVIDCVLCIYLTVCYAVTD